MNKKTDKIDNFEEKFLGVFEKYASYIEKSFLKEKKKNPQLDIKDYIFELKKGRKNYIQKKAEKKLYDKIFAEIDSYLLKKYAKLKVSFLGPEATFTHQAAKVYFGSFVDFIPVKSISDVFYDVESEKSDFGVAPVENSVEGAVSHTLDLFISSDVNIYSEILLPIKLNLLSNSSLNSINAVCSRSIVFGQCRNWLRNNLPNAKLIETTSTAEAVRMVKNKKHWAAIGSSLCSEIYGVKVVAESIQDESTNTTRFLVISKKKNKKGAKNKTSIVYLIKDKPGALFDSLKPFKEYGVNLVKIESRPSKLKAWEYYFFVDMEGYVEDKKVKNALSDLKEQTVFMKILGSYPIE